MGSSLQWLLGLAQVRRCRARWLLLREVMGAALTQYLIYISRLLHGALVVMPAVIFLRCRCGGAARSWVVVGILGTALEAPGR